MSTKLVNTNTPPTGLEPVTRRMRHRRSSSIGVTDFNAGNALGSSESTKLDQVASGKIKAPESEKLKNSLGSSVQVEKMDVTPELIFRVSDVSNHLGKLEGCIAVMKKNMVAYEGPPPERMKGELKMIYGTILDITQELDQISGSKKTMLLVLAYKEQIEKFHEMRGKLVHSIDKAEAKFRELQTQRRDELLGKYDLLFDVRHKSSSYEESVNNYVSRELKLEEWDANSVEWFTITEELYICYLQTVTPISNPNGGQYSRHLTKTKLGIEQDLYFGVSQMLGKKARYERAFNRECEQKIKDTFPSKLECDAVPKFLNSLPVEFRIEVIEKAGLFPSALVTTKEQYESLLKLEAYETNRRGLLNAQSDKEKIRILDRLVGLPETRAKNRAKAKSELEKGLSALQFDQEKSKKVIQACYDCFTMDSDMEYVEDEDLDIEIKPSQSVSVPRSVNTNKPVVPQLTIPQPVTTPTPKPSQTVVTQPSIPQPTQQPVNTNTPKPTQTVVTQPSTQPTIPRLVLSPKPVISLQSVISPTTPKPIQPAVTQPTTPQPITVVTVQCNTNGKKLFARGTGPGMSWDKGVELKFADGKFLFETAPGYKDFEFKVLIDDKQWSNGENFKVQAGKTISITPNF